MWETHFISWTSRYKFWRLFIFRGCFWFGSNLIYCKPLTLNSQSRSEKRANCQAAQDWACNSRRVRAGVEKTLIPYSSPVRYASLQNSICAWCERRVMRAQTLRNREHVAHSLYSPPCMRLFNTYTYRSQRERYFFLSTQKHQSRKWRENGVFLYRRRARVIFHATACGQKSKRKDFPAVLPRSCCFALIKSGGGAHTWLKWW